MIFQLFQLLYLNLYLKISSNLFPTLLKNDSVAASGQTCDQTQRWETARCPRGSGGRTDWPCVAGARGAVRTGRREGPRAAQGASGQRRTGPDARTGPDSALARGPSPRVALGGPAGPGEADDGPGRPCAGPGRAGLCGLGRGLRGGKATERGRYPERVRTAACPEVGATSPLSILNVVLFPAPLAPSSPKHCAGRGGGVSPRAAGGGVRL